MLTEILKETKTFMAGNWVLYMFLEKRI